MKTTTPKVRVKIKSAIRSGRLASNHNASGVKIKSAIRSGRLATNHNAIRARV